jgi:hypothetical protein
MSHQEVPSSAPLSGVSGKARSDRLLLALAFNMLGVLLYVFGLVAPLTPSHGHPSVSVVLIFVGGPIAFVWLASSCISSIAARIFLYIEILLFAGFSCYVLFVVEGHFR